MALVMPWIPDRKGSRGREPYRGGAPRRSLPGVCVIRDPKRRVRPYESRGLTPTGRLPIFLGACPPPPEQVARIRAVLLRGHQGRCRARWHPLSGPVQEPAYGVRRCPARHGQVQPHPRRSTTTTRGGWPSPGGDQKSRRHPGGRANAGYYYGARSVLAASHCTIGPGTTWRRIPAAVPASNTAMTTNNVLGCEIVLMTGRENRCAICGKSHGDAGVPHLLGVRTGSEGLALGRRQRG